MADVKEKPASPYERIGERAVIAKVVDRFYDLMDDDPAYTELRAMHAADLTPMRASLTDFMMAWMGGPRDWFETRPGACIMSAHGKLGISRESAAQWMGAMQRALLENVDDPPFTKAMLEALSNMSRGMARPAA